MIGLKIKYYMEKNGIKQKFISKKTNLSIQTVNAILNENRKIEVTEYYDICKALGLSLDYLFTTDIKTMSVGEEA